MPRTGYAIEADEEQPPPRFRRGFVVAIAVFAVLFAWVPGLGLLLSLLGLALGIWSVRHQLHRGAAAWAIALSVLGLVLGAAFTGIYLAFPPTGPTDEERQTSEAFDRQFEPPSPVAPDRAAPPGPPPEPSPPPPPQGPPGAR